MVFSNTFQVLLRVELLAVQLRDVERGRLAADGVHIDGTLAFADGCDLAFFADFRYFLIARSIAELRAVLQRFP